MASPAEPALPAEEFARFRQIVEEQTPRQLRRYLQYGKRVRSGNGLPELLQWLGRILLDETGVYALEDRARAFEIAACERLADAWSELEAAHPRPVAVVGLLDKTLLYRHALSTANGWERRAAFAQALAERYPKSWEWVCERAAAREQPGMTVEPGGSETLFDRFLERLDQLEVLAAEGIGAEGRRLWRELEERQDAEHRQEAEIGQLRSDLEFAEDRANRAHRRLKEQESELQQLRKQWQETRENGEKLREERSRRIKLDRQTVESGRELERLREECAKLDRRLQQMAQRLAASEQQRLTDQARLAGPLDLASLRQLDPGQVLGVGQAASGEELNQVRRRFAAAFHSDRVSQLPAWVGRLFDDVLGVVNEACDRIGK